MSIFNCMHIPESMGIYRLNLGFQVAGEWIQELAWNWNEFHLSGDQFNTNTCLKNRFTVNYPKSEQIWPFLEVFSMLFFPIVLFKGGVPLIATRIRWLFYYISKYVSLKENNWYSSQASVCFSNGESKQP